MKELVLATLDSPIGTVLIVADGQRLCALDFADCEERMMMLLQRHYGSAIQFVQRADPMGFCSRVRAYFAGDLQSLDAIAVCTGGTHFQQLVWTALRTIRPGTTSTYKDLAIKLGKPTAYRAVGATNALNPVGIVLPCHRVIGSDTSLTGYAGGLARKEWLLRHESACGQGAAVSSTRDSGRHQQGEHIQQLPLVFKDEEKAL
jgi:methylated-DNA-[protein]-cysteine S-methyltransferase